MMTFTDMLLLALGLGLIVVLTTIAHGLGLIGLALKSLTERPIHVSLTTGDYSGATFNVKAELSAPAAPIKVTIAKDGQA